MLASKPEIPPNAISLGRSRIADRLRHFAICLGQTRIAYRLRHFAICLGQTRIAYRLRHFAICLKWKPGRSRIAEGKVLSSFFITILCIIRFNGSMTHESKLSNFLNTSSFDMKFRVVKTHLFSTVLCESWRGTHEIEGIAGRECRMD